MRPRESHNREFNAHRFVGRSRADAQLKRVQSGGRHNHAPESATDGRNQRLNVRHWTALRLTPCSELRVGRNEPDHRHSAPQQITPVYLHPPCYLVHAAVAAVPMAGREVGDPGGTGSVPTEDGSYSLQRAVAQ